VYSAPNVNSEIYPEWSVGGGMGVEGTFAVTPTMPDVVEYVYSVDVGPPGEITVPAAADGTATIAYTPTSNGYHTFVVRSRGAGGQLSGARNYTFIVDWGS
jgi:hypothetical protein